MNLSILIWASGAASLAALTISVAQTAPHAPIVGADVVFEEVDGLVAIEAEHFFKQELTDLRAWHIVHAADIPDYPDDVDDPPHVLGTSGGAYLEILPDTRATHDHVLTSGVNFSNEPGKMAIISYKVHFNNPGRYHVWSRIFSTGGEDNGTHVGIDGTWPESGQRWQTVKKQAWQWDSRQRTETVHVGVPGQLFIDVPMAGEHVISFSLREDGFEMDKFVLTNDPGYEPQGEGPAPRVKEGNLPQAFAIPAGYTESSPESAQRAAETAHGVSSYPTHWGEPPMIQTRDYILLPGGYGHGSSTLAKWIQGNLDKDAAAAPGFVMRAIDFPVEGTGYYVDRDKWLAIDPDQHQNATAKTTVPAGNARFNVTLFAVGENDGSSIYTVTIGGRELPPFECPLSEHSFEEGPRFVNTWKNVEINEGEMIEVRAEVASADGVENSRARWSKIVLTPVDQDPSHLAAAIAAYSSAENVGAMASAESAAPPAPQTPMPERPAGPALIEPREPHGDGSVKVTGELKQWHKITLDLAGPYAHELDNSPNPYTDYRFHVTFTHQSGAPVYTVPGYFAADGDAANTSAAAGTTWRAHFAPDRFGTWTYRVSFMQGDWAAIEPSTGESLAPYHGASGTIKETRTDKKGRDFRGKGRLQYVGGHYLQHAGNGEFFLKAGPDAPETLLAYGDFDGTEPGRKRSERPGEAAPTQALKTWQPHVQDWQAGDPTWQDGKGKGLIGALNYLAAKGMNVVSFLPYNAGGDGDNVWPFTDRHDKFHYDCSKLDQWGVVFDHSQKLGLYLHFKLQENELDDNRAGAARTPQIIPESLDGGLLGPERKVYLREIIARYGHALALNWNLGEENTQSYEEQRDMAAYINLVDPYDHHIVIHTFPSQQDKVYRTLIGPRSVLTGASAQNSWSAAHQRTLQWVRESAAAGRPWVVANDEQNPAGLGVPPDPGYEGFSGTTEPDNNNAGYSLHEVRKYTLWGNLMAGGAGVEYYFGYRLPQNDLICEDFRSRDKSWDYCRIALEFFRDEGIPFWIMRTNNALVGNAEDTNARYCFAKEGELYLVYLPEGGTTDLDLSGASGTFTIAWLNPRTGGKLANGSVKRVKGGGKVSLGSPPADVAEDWLVVVRR